jgi:hypothetical protein
MRRFSLILWCTVAVARAESGAVTGQVVRAGTQQPVPNAVVYLSAAGRSETNHRSVTVEFAGNTLQPHVQVAARGVPIIMQNNDPALHLVAVDWLSGTNGPQRLLTQAMPYAGFAKVIPVPAGLDTGVIRIAGLNGEETAVAYVAVLPHPWAAVTDAFGRYAVTNAPVGPTKVYVWHEAAGSIVREVRIASGRATNLTLEVTATVRPRSD